MPQASAALAREIEPVDPVLEYAIQEAKNPRPVTVLTEQEDGSVTAETHQPDPATHEQIALAFEDDPWLWTGIMWSSLPVGDRVQALREGRRPVSLALVTDMTQILPEPSLRFLAAWQRMVNDGGVWNTSGMIGRRARALIDEGFCLLSPAGTIGPYSGRLPSRLQVRAGTPGSPVFVKTMMGDAYLGWIEAIL